MVSLFKPKPQFFKYVDKPSDASTKELASARPIYIDGLPAGGETPGIDDIPGLRTILDDYEQRIAALEGEQP